jgi:hypothetical protein
MKCLCATSRYRNPLLSDIMARVRIMAIYTKHGIKWSDHINSTGKLEGIIVRQTEKVDHKERAGLIGM